MGSVICQGCGTEHATWTGRCPHCGNTEVIRVDAQADRMINRVVAGRYRILSKIGQGGMGSVYLGELVGIGQRVALKFLNSNFSLDPEIARRFLNEAKSYARVAHPHAVVLHDFAQDEEGGLFISMEYVEGADLKRILADQRRVPVAEAIEIVLQVADVLAYAHGKGVIHRDLKPENIMVRKGTRGIYVKVLDFGIARMVEEGTTRVTAQGAIAGTPRYMAPEQAEGKEIDARVDIYSLGLVLFELLSGVQPFDGATVGEILRKQILLPTPHLRDVAPDLELPDVDAVIQRATAKNRDERYANMEQFSADLTKSVPIHLLRPAGPLEADATESDRTFIPSALAKSRVTDFGKAVSVEKTPVPAKPAASRPGLWMGGALVLALVAGGTYVVRLRPQPPRPSDSSSPDRSGVTDRSGTLPPPNPTDPTPSDVKLERMHWRERARDAKTQFALGNLAVAKSMLDQIPSDQKLGDDKLEDEVGNLRKDIGAIEDKLVRADAHSRQGDCDAAIRLYGEILKANPKVHDAKAGRDWCQKRMAPLKTE